MRLHNLSVQFDNWNMVRSCHSESGEGLALVVFGPTSS
jgi:hypothetical protein